MGRKIFVLFFVIAGLNSIEAQSRAFLESGPLAVSGMPGIGLNSIHGYRGVYMFSGGAREAAAVPASIVVYFAQTNIPVFSGWRIAAASPNTIYETETETVFVYIRPDNWAFFIDFQTKENINLSFAASIVRQMVFFIRDGSEFVNTSFPAIIEF
ncbi:MAG: hypothetical protein FWC36_02550 [Spirochaetes bacterium]|nr:hypothetical protein [Spirochaetota bacterium]